MGLNVQNDVVLLLNRSMELGTSSFDVTTYLYCATVRLHDAILIKFINAFFSGLLVTNLLSNNSRATAIQKEQFAYGLNKSEDFYNNDEYSNAWHNTRQGVMENAISAGFSVGSNVRRH